ncbi:MAG: SulP family inorganic anion transporter, partial [Gemmatimonadales bacterium]
VETIRDRFGPIAGGLPMPRIPQVDLSVIPQLIAPAFTIAILGAIEALLSAVVADGMIGGRHRSNMELVAEGVANMTVPFFGGIPATGAIARTATNVKNGGRTPVAGLIHALTLLLIVLFAGRWVGMIPLAALAAILVVVAYHMSEWRTIVSELRGARSDVLVMLTTLSLTVLWDLTVAIQVGLVLAAFLFMRRMAEVTDVSAFAPDLADDGAAPDAPDSLPPGVLVYEVNGPFFFGAADRFTDALGQIGRRPQVVIIRLRHVPMMDSTGLRALREATRKLRQAGTVVLLADVQHRPLQLMKRTGLMDELGADHVYLDLDAAIARSRALSNVSTTSGTAL